MFSHLECANFQPFHRLPQPGNGFGFKNDSTAILAGKAKIFLQVDFPPCQAQDGLFGLPHHESGNDAVYPCGSEARIHLHGLFRDYGRYRRLRQKPGFQAGGRGPVSESRHIRCCFLYRSSYYFDQLLFRIRFEKHRSMNCKPSSRHKPAQSSISGNSIKVGMPISINLYHLAIVIG